MHGLTEIERLINGTSIPPRSTLMRLVEDLAQHAEDARVRESRIRACESKLQEILSQPQNPTSIPTLIEHLTNEYQQEALRKLLARDENSHVYLSKYETNTSTDRKKQGIQGTFTILGTMKKGVREEYEVKMYKPGASEKGTFWCSCPDHKFNSTKKNMCCKHICFLVCRVGKLYDPPFFETKQLTVEQFEAFKIKAENTQQLLSDLTICRPNAHVTQDLFHSRSKPLGEDDLCPICYDDMHTCAEVDVLSCPGCTNYVHKRCMEVWLERHDTCVYCRSETWKHYR